MNKSFSARLRRFLARFWLLPALSFAVAFVLLARGWLRTYLRPKVPDRPSMEELYSDPAKAGANFPTTCLGEATAKNQAIFLHGIMPAKAIPPELDYTKRLQRIAAASQYRIAMPLSRQYCNDSRSTYCWTGNDRASILATYHRILRSSAKCLKLDRPFGLIGFSNGGYHAARVAMRCIAPQPAWVLAMGSAGDPSHAEGRSLENCPSTTLLIGTTDITRSAAELLAATLVKMQLPVTFATFPGGHDVPDDRLIEFLRSRQH